VDNDTLATSVAVGGAQTLTRQIPLTLSEDLDSTGYTVYFGNEYTGYTAFQVKLGSGLPVIIDPLLLAGIGAGVLIAVVVVIYWVKFR
jgi:hypothetical protein